MSEDYNGYLIEDQGGHKIVVTKPDDPDFPVTHFRWVHNARAWIDELPPEPPARSVGRSRKVIEEDDDDEEDDKPRGKRK